MRRKNEAMSKKNDGIELRLSSVSENIWKSLAIYHVMNENRARKYMKVKREFKAICNHKYLLSMF